ncbi:unnamed protein product [Rhizoctonia solani]|uniref:Peptidase C14 caspase domain-containing protein n=1 Tax=Rhizoctonia solani TaxID=456999 RepID=A0A8H3BG44_9AGAM|nr:unnamed protein product [Rhizoctonia solani]
MQSRRTDFSQLVAKLCLQEPESNRANTSYPRKANLFALLIGIDRYSGGRHNLTGAAADARAFKSYLTGDQGVPVGHIGHLENETATREGILNAVISMKDNANIHPQDAIVIFFAGHGAELDPPTGWDSVGGKVQCIIPYDASGPTEVPPIPDFTIAALLHSLAEEKGDNITVIFDCCHAASGSRGDDQDICSEEARLVARFIKGEELMALPPDLDTRFLQLARRTGRSLVVPKGFAYQGSYSHVFLAACGHAEQAWEDPHAKRGLFTMALLETLRKFGTDQLSYKGCIQRMPPLRTHRSQNPICEGEYVHRTIFNGILRNTDQFFITIIKSDKEAYYLKAGLAQGITPGCLFAVHANHVHGPDNTPLCTAIVEWSYPFRSKLRVLDEIQSMELPTISYGYQVGWGGHQALRVYFTKALCNVLEPSSVWESIFSGSQTSALIQLVSQESARMVVDVDSRGRATFRTTHPAVIAHKCDILPHSVQPTASNITRVLQSAARWDFFVNHTPASGHPFRSTIHIEFTLLSNQVTKHGQIGARRPTGENLNQGGVVDIVVKDGDLYGMKLVNSSNRNLYAYVFYFGLGDQSITPKFIKVIGNARVDPSLPCHSALTLGC